MTETTQSNQALDLLGELILTGFEGKTLSEDTAHFLSQAKLGGVILFSHNYESPRQIAELISAIQDCRSALPFWISVDQEGGRVQRFREGFTRIPSAREISQINSPKGVFTIAEILGKELKAVGVNLNFAPVADLLTHKKNEVIGDRSFGSDESLVSRMVSAFVRGMVKSGIQPCVKHFPGHGNVAEDSHTHLPKCELTLKQLRELEFKPFIKAFKSRCNLVMTAHIMNPNLDENYPATLSPKTLQEVLRKELRYAKCVISDDMEMAAITNHFGEEEAPVQAIRAGCDLLIYRSEAGARKAYEAMKRALENGELSSSRIIEAASRSQAIKREVLMPYEKTQLETLAEKVGTANHEKEIVDLLNG